LRIPIHESIHATERADEEGEAFGQLSGESLVFQKYDRFLRPRFGSKKFQIIRPLRFKCNPSFVKSSSFFFEDAAHDGIAIHTDLVPVSPTAITRHRIAKDVGNAS
jgi:hypothetical protein